jgi:hypothetical protein
MDAHSHGLGLCSWKLQKINKEENIMKTNIALNSKLLYVFPLNWIGKLEGKRPIGRPRCRWKDNIKIELREIGREGMDWMHLAQDRNQWRTFGNTVMKLRFL